MVLEELKNQMDEEEENLYEVAELFKNLADSSRVKILHLLSKRELCVKDIAELLNISQSGASHQLRVLRQSRLIKGKKIGLNVLYSLNDDHVVSILNQAMEHVLE